MLQTQAKDQAIRLKYAVISPVRNEAQYIEKTLKSMVNQTIQPNEWLIVDDLSTDETPQIVAEYARENPWLKLLSRDKRDRQGDRQRGKGVVDTFYYGYEHLSCRDVDFIIKLDGDVSFEPTYFEFLLNKFVENPRLGIAGGGLYERTDGEYWSLVSAPDHVGGPAKMYRQACFEDIGGIVSALGWDGLDEWQALAKGWEVQSFEQQPVFHYRIMGNATGLLKARVEQGYGAYYMAYHPLYALARGARYMFIRPYFVGGLVLVAGYLQAVLQNREQLPEPDLRDFIQRTQLHQIVGGLSGNRVYKSQGVVATPPSPLVRVIKSPLTWVGMILLMLLVWSVARLAVRK